MQYTSASSRRCIAAVAVGCAVLVAIAGCSGSDSSAAPSPSLAITPSPTTSASSTSAGTSPQAESSSSSAPEGTGEQVVPTDTSERSYDGPVSAEQPTAINDIRLGRHSTYDRVVIDFVPDGGVPDYTIGWLSSSEELRAPGSGKSVQLESNRILQVQLRHTKNEQPREDKPQLPAVREIRAFPSFEAQTKLGIGVYTINGSAKVVGFRVSRLSSGPPRLVIDVAHADAYERATS